MFVTKEYWIRMQEWLIQIRLPVYILVILFAMASWIDINGLWTELPLLVGKLPELWNLPSYLIIIIQIANIGPITYTLINRYSPNKVKEWPVVYVIILIGIAACTLLIFFWDETSHIFGEERSTSLICLSFFLALVDTTSSVVFLPYMANFKVQYMTAFYIGEGMSGLLPAMVGLIQGVGSDPDCTNISQTITNETTGENTTIHFVVPFYDEPLFSVEVFFLFLTCMLVVSGLAFTVLNFTEYCKQEMLVQSTDAHIDPEKYAYRNEGMTGEVVEETVLTSGKTFKVAYSGTVGYVPNEKSPASNRYEISNLHAKQEANLDKIGIDTESRSLSDLQFIYLFLTSVVINGLSNGVIPSTASYSALPYSNRAYNLSTRIGMAANPLACFFALFVPCKSLILLGVVTVFGIALAGYQLYLADMSPSPPLQDETSGEVLVIVTAVIMVGLFSYGKVTIASMMRDNDGRRGLLWCGVSQQVGSFIGAITIFIFVNVIESFTDAPPCPP